MAENFIKPKFSAYASHYANGPFEPYSYFPKELGPFDIEIHVSHCGICHTDIHINSEEYGPTKGRPFVGGHEIIGIISQIGVNVKHLYLGQRVGVGAQCSSCMNFESCKSCKFGDDHICPSAVYTCNSKLPDGSVTFGGFQNKIRIPSSHVVEIPQSLSSELAAPLMCAGITVFSPLKRYGAGHVKKRVGIIGLGGLGHLAIQFAAKMGAKVTVFSSSSLKIDDAFAMGASQFVLISDPEQVRQSTKSIDLMINTVSSRIDLDFMFSFMDTDGIFVQLGGHRMNMSLNASALIFKRLHLTGSLIGSLKELNEMLIFAANHNICPWVQKIPMSEINNGIKMIVHNKARYRIVLENEQFCA